MIKPCNYSTVFGGILFLMVTLPVFAQDQQINWVCSHEEAGILKEEKLWKAKFDSSEYHLALKEALNRLRNKGYLLATIDSGDDKTYRTRISIGQQYLWASLKQGTAPEELLDRTAYKEKLYTHRQFDYKQTAKLMQKLITESENSGYPFASVKLDSVDINGSEISASLNYESGPLIRFDSLNLNGDATVDPGFLERYLGVQYGTPFRQSKVALIESKLAELPYLRLHGPARLLFKNNEAEVDITLENVRSNYVDGVIGFLPGEENKKLLITGQFDLGLVNPFGRGKTIKINWQGLKPLTQQLDARYVHPLILGSPLTVKIDFNIIKEDTTFINRSTTFGLEVDLLRYQKIRLFTMSKRGRLLGTLSNFTELPKQLDFNLNQYGIGYKYSKLDNIMNPIRGLSGELQLSVGSKTIRKNAAIGDYLYEGINLNTSQYEIVGKLENYVKLRGRAVVFTRAIGGKLFNSQLVLNELFRLGGLKSVRGFNQNFFFASDYFIFTSELRFLIGPVSYLFAFYDQGYLYYNVLNSSSTDYPIGLGLGISMATDNGIFNFAYALGQNQDQKFAFNLSKIHFGYIAKF